MISSKKNSSGKAEGSENNNHSYVWKLNFSLTFENIRTIGKNCIDNNIMCTFLWMVGIFLDFLVWSKVNKESELTGARPFFSTSAVACLIWCHQAGQTTGDVEENGRLLIHSLYSLWLVPRKGCMLTSFFLRKLIAIVVWRGLSKKVHSTIHTTLIYKGTLDRIRFS